MEELLDQQHGRIAARGFREIERACLPLVETELEVAFSFLRLAEAETNGGNSEHAAELIGKAITTHNTALTYLASVSPDFEAENREIYLEARKLFEAIRAAERRRQSDSLVFAAVQSMKA